MSSSTTVQSDLLSQDFLEERARQLAIWASKRRVACLLPDEDIAVSLNSVLVQLLSSRVCCAQECRALVVVSRESCRSLGQLDVMSPLFDLVVRGFEEIRFLADSATSCMQALDDGSESAMVRLQSVTKAELISLRIAANSSHPARPFVGQPALEMASQILQPSQKIHDHFAVRRLVADLRVAERAILFSPMHTLHLQLAHRQRILKHFATHSDAISALAHKQDALGAIAEWLLVVNQSLCDLDKIRETHKIKQAITSHIVPLARWALRPHGRLSLFNRPKPPPSLTLPPSRRLGKVAFTAECAAIRAAQRETASSQCVPKAPASRPQSARSRLRDKVSEARGGTYLENLRNEWGTAPSFQGTRFAPDFAAMEKTKQEPLTRKSPSVHSEESLAPGLGATRRLELWLREHGKSRHQHVAFEEALDVRNAAAPQLLPQKVKKGAASTCSTASTEAESHLEQGQQMNTIASFSASSSVDTSRAPDFSYAAPSIPWAPKAHVQQNPGEIEKLEHDPFATAVSVAAATVAAVTETPCALELSSDEEDILDLGAHSPLDAECTNVASSRALHMRAQQFA